MANASIVSSTGLVAPEAAVAAVAATSVSIRKKELESVVSDALPLRGHAEEEYADFVDAIRSRKA